MPPSCLHVRCHLVAVSLLLSIVPTAAGQGPAATQLKYALSRGIKLKYTAASQSKGGGVAIGSDTEWTIWTLREAPRDEWDIVVRSIVTRRVTGRPPSEQVSMTRCRMRNDGSVNEPLDSGFVRAVGRVLPPLPRRDEWSGGKASYDRHGGSFTAQLRGARRGPNGRNLTLEIGHSSPLLEALGVRSTAVVEFDSLRGIPISILERRTQPSNGREGRTTIQLEGVEHLGVRETVLLAGDFDTYFDAIERRRVLLNRIESDPANADTCAKEIAASISSAIASIRDDDILKLLRGHKARQSRDVESASRIGRKASRFVGQQSPDWRGNDLNGHRHRLDQYRGRVLVLDFWYRGCYPCLQAMPSMKAVSTEWRNRSVVVLGINIDRNVNDARHVATAMGLNYANVSSPEIASLFDVTEFPTVIIVDRKGIVRAYLVGHQPNLSRRLIHLVSEIAGDE